MSSQPTPPSDYQFAFIVQERFTQNSAGMYLTVSDGYKINTQSISGRVMLRTPAGKLIESYIVQVIKLGFSHEIVKLHLIGINHHATPPGTELFTQVRAAGESAECTFEVVSPGPFIPSKFPLPDKMNITYDSTIFESHAPDLVWARVWINDCLPFEDDYTIDMTSFFTTLESEGGSVSFTGGCGIPECCAVGFTTAVNENMWQWDDFHFSWSNVYEIANELITILEELPHDHYSYSNYQKLLPEFRSTRDKIKLRHLSS